MKKTKNSDVTIIIPTLNEAENISEVVQELHQFGYWNILVIDGNSSDGTVEIAKELGVNMIIQNGRGKGNALCEALLHAHNGFDTDVFIVMDADGSMIPEEIPLFLQAIESGTDLAKGSRFMKGGGSEDMDFIRRVGNRLLLLLVNLFWSSNYTDLCYGFLAFRREAINELSSCLRSTGFEIETEILIKARKLGLRVVEVPSVELRRRRGKSHLRTFPDGFRILRQIIAEVITNDR